MLERFGFVSLSIACLLIGQGCDSTRVDRGRSVTIDEVKGAFLERDQVIEQIMKRIVALEQKDENK